jgi:hypothetical protein
VKLEKRSVFGWPKSGAGSASPRNGIAVHYDGSNQGLAKKTHAACRTYWKNTRKFHMGPSRGWADVGYCVDEETEILTGEGWKTFEQVQAGDLALTLDHETGMSQWQPVEDVYIFPAVPREMIRMEGRQHSSLTTPNHRWPVERFYRRTGTERQKKEDGTWKATGTSERSEQGRQRTWATTETLTYWDRIPISAECADTPSEAKWSDAFVEVLAWFWTEGHIRPQSRSRAPSTGVAIYQKEGARAARIRAALRSLFGPPVDEFPRSGQRTDGVPRWRETTNRHLVEFYLSVDAGKLLLEQAPERIVRFDFLRSLTRAQLDLFIRVSLLADGSNGQTVTWHELAQKNKAMAEAFQFAATLAGMATSLRQLKSGMWCVHLRHLTHFTPKAAASRNGTFNITTERYDGRVWCVSTPNRTWLAKRRGTVYFTGNSFAVCPHGIVMEGRGLNKVQAAQPGGNATWYSVTFMSGPSESPTAAQINAFRQLRAWLRGKGVKAAIKPHSAFISTSCCGNILRKLISNGTLASTKPFEEELDMDAQDVFKAVWERDSIPAPPGGPAGPNWRGASFLTNTYRDMAKASEVEALRTEVGELKSELAEIKELLSAALPPK